MKRLLPGILALALTGCSAIAPMLPKSGPTSTPQVVYQTVEVTVLVTQVVTATPEPTLTPTLTPIPTMTPTVGLTGTAGTQAATGTAGTGTPGSTGSAQATGSPATSGPTATLPADAGGTLFTNLTRSSDHFSLRCQPDTITFGITATDPRVASVDLFYRMEDQGSSSVSGWSDIGKMSSDGNGNFTMDFPASRIDPDVRTRAAWLDYQFIGLDKQAQVVGRSGKIVKQITFTIDCP